MLFTGLFGDFAPTELVINSRHNRIDAKSLHLMRPIVVCVMLPHCAVALVSEVLRVVLKDLDRGVHALTEIFVCSDLVHEL